uniref:Uncharacterized protein n=1 Tax=Octactis speculum TaxID=3111310 RepID=A0A7S2E043_9STRA|mmetsp:Transcript_55977/g.76377  ORF Transcript_55977/g.76377 Transcript_55977/m.76377 type:complete len:177 (+) Transcript_55977:220-750(+)
MLLRSRFLETLNISYCGKIVGSLDALSSCRSLASVNMKGCEGISGTLDFANDCPLIEELVIMGTGTTGTLDALSECKRLAIIDVGFTEITGSLDPLTACKSLRSLNIEGCGRISGSLETLARGVEKLTYLNIYNCLGLSGPVYHLNNCKNLKVLVGLRCPKSKENDDLESYLSSSI